MNHSPLDTTIPSSFRSAPFGTVRWSWPSWWDWCGCTRWPSRSTSPWWLQIGWVRTGLDQSNCSGIIFGGSYPQSGESEVSPIIGSNN